MMTNLPESVNETLFALQEELEPVVTESVISPLFATKTDPCIERCDTDGDGKLDYQEFKSMIFRSKARKEENINEEEKDFKRKAKTIKKDVPKKGKKGKGSK